MKKRVEEAILEFLPHINFNGFDIWVNHKKVMETVTSDRQ